MGYSLDISQCGVLVDVVGDPPPLMTRCHLILETRGGNLDAQARVVRIDPSSGLMAMELEEIHSDAQVLLSALLASGSV